ncbi:MAG: lysophospholipid acyltransferase family protein [Desulfobacterales bacterium]
MPANLFRTRPIAALHLALIMVWTVSATFVLGLVAVAVSVFSRSGNFVHRIARLWGKSILWVSGVRVAVCGRERLDPRRPCIFMANHQSNYDIPVLLGHLPVQFRWLAKAELFRIPLFGRAMRGAGYIPIDRKDRASAFHSLREAAEKIRAGASIVIFPEGTRSPDGELKPFKKGGFVLALQARAPVVPIGIRGTREVMPKGSLWIRPGRVTVTIGRPIDLVSGVVQTREELMEAVRRAILEATAACGAGDPCCD